MISSALLGRTQRKELQGYEQVFSCAYDLSIWLRAMINMEGPLSKKAHKELRKPRISVEGSDQYRELHPLGKAEYALGHYVQKYRGNTVIGHTGNAPGYGSLMRFSPELGWGVVILGNSTNALKVAEMLFLHLLDENLGVDQKERFD